MVASNLDWPDLGWMINADTQKPGLHSFDAEFHRRTEGRFVVSGGVQQGREVVTGLVSAICGEYTGRHWWVSIITTKQPTASSPPTSTIATNPRNADSTVSLSIYGYNRL